MIIPTCRCQHPHRPEQHHSPCPAVAEPQPLSAVQIHFLAELTAREILSRKSPDGSPLFPNLLAHLDPT